MKANLQDYLPEVIDFCVPDSITEKFPPVIFEGATDVDDVIKQINDNFNATFPENEVALRKLDEYEISEIREEYCLKQENEVPKREREYLEAVERAKDIKNTAQERLASIKTEIKDLAAEVKNGTQEYELSSKNTVKFALDGYWLYYSWVNGAMKLVKSEKIPNWDKRSLWAQEDRNRKAMLDLFGIEYPEVQRPFEESEDFDEATESEEEEEE